MRIMVLGGAGVMGGSAVSQLVKYSDADVIVADINLEKAKRLSEQLGKNRVSALFVDINHYKSLVKTIKTAAPDVVASAAGPFYKYADNVYRAVLEAGVDCVDLCDDYPGAKTALSLDEEAKEAGITIITGMGDSPGMTNIIVKYMAGKLDHVDNIDISWVTSVTESLGMAVLKHSFLTFAETTHQFLDGKLTEVQGFSGKETIEFPSPVGKCEVMYCDHPEPFTLPLHIKDVKNVTCKGGMCPTNVLNPAMDIWTRLGLTSTEPIQVGKVPIAPIDFISAFLINAAKKAEKEGIPPIGAQRIEVTGERKGDPTRYVWTVTGSMISNTPRVLVTAAKLLAKGKIKVKGVYPPEGCIDPELFLQEFGSGKLDFVERAYEHVVEITRKES